MAKAAFECDDLEMVRYFEDEEPDNDYHFEIMERIVVTVPRPRHGLLPRCTCTHPTSRGLCKHLWWLLDHVVFEFTRARATGNEDVEVSFTGEAASLQRRNTVDRQTVHSILEERIDDIVRRHSWVEYDSDDEEVRQSQTVGLFSLVETQGLLPTEFAALDPADNSQPVPRYVKHPPTSSRILTIIHSRLLRSYVTTVLARAASDPRIHQRVKTLLGAYYDNVVLQKLRTRVRVIFDDYDLMRAGHAVDVHNVADCASRLWDASSSVSGLLRNRAGNIRPSPALRHALAGFLLDILVGVLEKRGDAHTGFRPPFLEAVARQDIFHYTIVQPPARTPAFVVSVLDQFVHVLDATLLERIEHIAVDLEQTPTPLTYISRLRSIASNALTRQRQGGDAA